MQIPQSLPQFLDSEALIIVAAKENGIIYRIKDGEVQKIETLEKPLPTYSDDEGYFFSAAGGGAPKERDDIDEYKKAFDRTVAAELDSLIGQESARVLYVFEPEHLKGRIIAELQKHPHVSVHTVRYGNYVHEDPLQLLKYIQEQIDEFTIDTDSHEYERDFKKF